MDFDTIASDTEYFSKDSSIPYLDRLEALEKLSRHMDKLMDDLFCEDLELGEDL